MQYFCQGFMVFGQGKNMELSQHEIFPGLGEACLMGLYGGPNAEFLEMNNDLRMFSRVHCSYDVDLWVKGHLYRCVTHNVSYGGMFIETCKAFSDGQNVFICVHLNRSGRLFSAQGEIIRNGPHGIGVRLLRELLKYKGKIFFNESSN